MDWMNQLKVNTPAATEAPKSNDERALIPQLLDAAARWDKRTDNFAAGKNAICRDMAAKLDRFGHFVSDRQRDFALKLIEWSKPRAQETRAQPWGDGQMAVPGIFAVMQKLSHLRFGALKISRKNQDSLCWLVWNGACVGKLADAVVTIFPAKAKAAQVTPQEIVAELQRIEADPLKAAKEYGHASGNCCVCGRDLTDPVSIENGIGPICAGYF